MMQASILVIPKPENISLHHKFLKCLRFPGLFRQSFVVFATVHLTSVAAVAVATVDSKLDSKLAAAVATQESSWRCNK